MIHMIDWTEAALLRKFGVNNEKRFRLLNWPQVKVEWLEDALSAVTTTTTEALDASETGIDVADGTLFKRGDVVKIADELSLVSSVASNTLTVIRGYAGSTAATHSTAATIDIVTEAQAEGATFVSGHSTLKTRPYNYTQIFSQRIDVTRSQQKVADYAVADTLAYELTKLIGGNSTTGGKFKAGTEPIKLQKTFYHGLRNGDPGDDGNRSMGGFNQFATTNVTDAASAALTRGMAEGLLETIFLAGGQPDCMICNTWPFVKFRNMFEGNLTSDTSSERGGSRITMLRLPWGGQDIEILFDRFCPNDEIYIVESDKVGWVTFDPFHTQDVNTSGQDGVAKALVGEYSFVLVNPAAHGRIHNISTTT
tara:strand:+ start:777 stop:1874 length:1098 start_codon:yes stop_codon:yes gene_type:complete